MKLKLNLIAAIALTCTIASCSSDDLAPSDDNRLVDFPQGNADYDDEILNIYNKYGTQMLYDYNDEMFRWQITDKLGYISTPANQPADKAYIKDAIAFMRSNCFDFYHSDSLKVMLPYRIYLASNLGKMFEYSGTNSAGVYVSIKDTIPNIASVNGYRNICFGIVNGRLKTMSEDSLRLAKGELNASIIASAIDRGVMQVPASFASLEVENVAWTNEPGTNGYNNYGLLEYLSAKSMTPSDDFASYLKMLIAYPKEEFNRRFTAKTFDLSGRIAKKADVVRKWMKEQHGIDVEKIAEVEVK